MVQKATQSTTASSFSRELAHILFERRRLIQAIFFLIFLPVLATAILLPPSYCASGKFVISVPEQLDPLRRENFYDYQNRAKRLLQQQKEIIFSDRVVSNVIQSFYPDQDAGKLSADVDIEKIKKKMEVTPPQGESFNESSVFYISYIDSNAKRAADYAGAICAAYLKVYNEIAKENAGFSFDFFKRQTDQLYEEMIQREKSLRDYEVEHSEAVIGMLNMESDRGTNMEVGPNALLTQYTGRYHDLQDQLAGISAAVGELEKEVGRSDNPAVLGDMQVPGHAIATFKNKVAQLQIQLNEMRSQFKDNFQPVQQAKKELEFNLSSLKDELARSIRAQKITAQAVAARIKELEEVIGELRQKIRSTAEQRAQYEHFKQQYNLAKDTYARARDQLEQSRLAVALDQAKQSITQVDVPMVPDQPIKPNRPLLIALGLLGGLLFAVAIAVTVDYLDHTIKRPEDIDRRLDVPIFGSLPRIG